VTRHRIDFTQAELSRLAEAAAKYRVPITIERIAPDGTKVTATANTQSSSDNISAVINPWDEVLNDTAEPKRAS
jgi:hypothetical protein